MFNFVIVEECTFFETKKTKWKMGMDLYTYYITYMPICALCVYIIYFLNGIRLVDINVYSVFSILIKE